MLKKVIKYVLDAMDMAADDTASWKFKYSYETTIGRSGDVEIIVPDVGEVFNIKVKINKDKTVTFSLSNSWSNGSLLKEDTIKVEDDEWIENGNTENEGEEYLQEQINMTILDFITKMKEDKISKALLDFAYYKEEYDRLLRLEGLMIKLRKVLPKDIKNNDDEKQLHGLILYFKNRDVKE